MSYLDSYKSMLLKRGGNVLNSDIKNSKDSINKQFKNDYSYKLAILKKKDKAIADSELDTRIVNNTNDKTKKNIYVRPNTKIETGDYIIYPDKTYLVLEVEENLISPYAEAKECNHLFKWMYKGVVYSAYGIGTNQTKYTLGTDAVQGIIESDSRYGVDLPYTDNTKNISIGLRFIFNGNAWKVTQVDYISSNGLLSVLLGQDSINEYDDLVNEIADRWLYNYNITLDSNTKSIEETGTYQIVANVTNNNQVVSNPNIIYSSSNEIVATVSESGLISGLKEGTCIITATIGSVSATLSLTVNAKSIEPVVSYGSVWSNGQLLRLMSSTTFTGTKMINSVIDENLIVDYELDDTGTSLLSSNKITIIQKVGTTNAYTIKNVNVNSTMSFVITFKDKNDGTIIDTKTISLKGM